jgi:magnesium chelatase accessory protein
MLVFPFMYESPSWRIDGADWPNRDSSRFVRAAEVNWHVQQMGSGPVVLLVHGTGASTHSWRTLAPILARDFTVVAPDLPGHGFSETDSFYKLSLPSMAQSLNILLHELQVKPALVVGHSAGAAVLIRLALDRKISPNGIVSLNGALMPFKGIAGQIFPPMAKLLFLNPLAPRVFARSATDRNRVEKLIKGTGSTIEPEGIDLYARLFRCSGHVAGALGMMANWDLKGLTKELSQLSTPLLLAVGANDRSVPPEHATRIQAMAPKATVQEMPGLGHLAHEEQPAVVAEILRSFARSVGALPEPITPTPA